MDFHRYYCDIIPGYDGILMLSVAASHNTGIYPIYLRVELSCSLLFSALAVLYSVGISIPIRVVGAGVDMVASPMWRLKKKENI